MIPEAYERRCIGRQIRRKLRSGAQETGRITGENRRDLPIIYYNVEWQTANQPIVEIMALSTLQTWFSEEDSYVDEAWVDEELRILQKVPL